MAITTQESEVRSLDIEYRAYIARLRADWDAHHPFRSNDVFEVMRPEERRRLQQHIEQWGRYVEPFAEAWWKERGYGVIWPDDNSKPMQVHKLA